MLNYLTDYPLVTSYLPVFLLAFYFAKLNRDKINVCIFMVFFVAGPYIRSQFFHEVNFYLFYSLYEFVTFSAFIGYNGFRFRYSSLYLLTYIASIANLFCWTFETREVGFIAEYYAPFNKLLIEMTFFFIIAFIDEIRAMMFAALILILPYWAGLFI